MKVAFYKGAGIFSSLIKLWTRSKYSHVEIILRDYRNGYCECLSSEPFDGVRIAAININPDEWDILEVNCSTDNAWEWYANNQGKGYDYLGILGFVLSPLKETKSRWFCSEIVADILGIESSSRFSPSILYSVLKYLNKT